MITYYNLSIGLFAFYNTPRNNMHAQQCKYIINRYVTKVIVNSQCDISGGTCCCKSCFLLMVSTRTDYCSTESTPDRKNGLCVY